MVQILGYGALVLFGLYQGTKLVDETGETIEQTGNASLKLGLVGAVSVGVYYAYKRGLI
jgi:hypothetical protein